MRRVNAAISELGDRPVQAQPIHGASKGRVILSSQPRPLLDC